MKHADSVLRLRYGIARDADFNALGLDDVLAIKQDTGEAQYRFLERGVKVADGDDNRLFEHFASTEHVDAMSDVIRASGWDLVRLKTGKVPLLWAHDSKPAPMGIVQRASKTGKTDDGVRALVTTSRVHEAEIYGDSEYGKHIETVVRLMQRGDLPGVSVGFVPMRARLPDNDEERESLGMTKPWGVIFEAQELLELSVTSVPANNRAQQKKALDRVETALREMVEKGEISGQCAVALGEALVPLEETWTERIRKIARSVVPIERELPWTKAASEHKGTIDTREPTRFGIGQLKSLVRESVREVLQEELSAVIRDEIEPLEAAISDLSERIPVASAAGDAGTSERADSHAKHAPNGAPARADASTGTSRQATNPRPRLSAAEALARVTEAAASRKDTVHASGNRDADRGREAPQGR